MRFLFALASLVLCSINLCLAVEASVVGASTGFGWYDTLKDLGVAGVFIMYLIYDRHAERKRKDDENKRWIALDERLLAMVEKKVEVDMDLAAALKEQRASNERLIHEVQRLITVSSTGADHRRRESDTRS